MNLHFIGHACFLISSADGTRLLIDPFQPRAFNGRIRLEPHSGPVDAVISTHSHLDHRHIDPSFGSPLVFEGPGQIHGIDIDCIKLPTGRLKERITALFGPSGSMLTVSPSFIWAMPGGFHQTPKCRPLDAQISFCCRSAEDFRLIRYRRRNWSDPGGRHSRFRCIIRIRLSI